MNPHEIEKMIKKGIPQSIVTIHDLAGDGNHYAAEIISEEFRGKNRIQQHQMVYDSLGNKMGNALHALSIKTSVPDSQ
ncbi:transcriptional regulator BolA [Candidatus Liberibacter asiaticus]|nr:transcriptional regulator BolA [Candidatus Liberibacter asiaticus]KAE9511358.1 transcriptional regulator BolA [Candidatus Liberibacter asiaticus]KAE9511967.1 transcriptional regulator BolA [Candidatus Liberibacter asiaticus]KAE9513059.1 transcriptional regulator BolA [Candidatus Liberibacter asiaticus]KAE9514146.1 transcriptional regulator BolA [Candidatus Liberibacter asiaticus]